MATTIPEKYLDLFQKPAFGVLATLMPDGQPQVTPVWVDWQDGRVIVNSAKGRQKDKNIERDPRVTITLIDPNNPYRYVEVRGRVDETTQQNADTHIDKMAKKYLGKDKYPFRQPGEVRVMYKIAPQKITAFGD
jgi:PPOX class probable F420-dependent enzyme